MEPDLIFMFFNEEVSTHTGEYINEAYQLVRAKYLKHYDSLLGELFKDYPNGAIVTLPLLMSVLLQSAGEIMSLFQKQELEDETKKTLLDMFELGKNHPLSKRGVRS